MPNISVSLKHWLHVQSTSNPMTSKLKKKKTIKWKVWLNNVVHRSNFESMINCIHNSQRAK